MKRTPEPELMDSAAQADAYAAADFSESNTLFVDLFRGCVGGDPGEGRVLDLGCGPADIDVRLAKAFPGLSIDAVDGAEHMLRMARKAITDAGLNDRITLIRRRIPDERLEAASYGAVISNSLLHHLADPLDLWRTLAHCGALNAAVVVMDLLRPEDEAGVEAVLETHAGDAPPVLLEDFRASLMAAYTPDEVAGQLAASGLGQLAPERVSDRHWAVVGRLGG